MSDPEKLRTAWLCPSPGPNTSAFYDALSRVRGCEVEVFYCAADHDKWRGSFAVSGGHAHHVLWNANPWAQRLDLLHTNPGVVPTFLDRRFDIVVIATIASPTGALAMATRWLARRPYAIWGEMVNRSGSGLRRVAQAHTVHALVRRADAVFTMGERARQSFRSIGVAPARILELPYCCDLQPYLDVERGPTPARRGRHRVATLSQLIPRKRVDLVIESFVALASACPDWDLVVGGDGPLAASLRERVPSGLRDRVQFAGFVGKAAQPEFYGAADLFVLASREDGWGMVVPEAMASGLPVISTLGVESAVALLAEGGGELVGPDDGPALRDAMARWMRDPALCAREGARARAIARHYDPAAIAARVATDLRRILRRS